MSYNKLVRDKIPEIIKNNNETPITRILSDEEYKVELEKKLLEEYASLDDATLEDIIELADKKRNKRGGFKEKIFLESVK